MKLLFAALISAIVPAIVTAAPPGVERWLTMAGPQPIVNNQCPGTPDLFSIGFIGQTSSGCLGLSNSTSPDELTVTYELWAGCTIDLYSDAGCADGTIVDSVVGPPLDSNTGIRGCHGVEEGFRALEVICIYDN